jgi:hypothetical protein
MLNNRCLNRSESRERSQPLSPWRAIRPYGLRPLPELKDLAGSGGTHMRMFETVAVEVVMNAG